MAEVELPNTEELSEMRSKRSTKRIALTTAVYAVILAIASLGGSNAMKEMLLANRRPQTSGPTIRPKTCGGTFTKYRE